ncbi:HAD family hydrolase [Enterococcus sp. LJL128]
MRYSALLFDLDGTITDSGKGIINSVTYALKKMKVAVSPQDNLRSFIGPPLKDSFMTNYDLDETAAEKAVAYYREYYRETGIYENTVYEGIPEVLKQLKQAGCQLYIATSKPEHFARQIADYFQLTDFFEGIYGASMDGIRSKKGDVIRYALNNGNINPAEAVMIGDREHDILGAAENNLPAVGVLYGYGSKEELTVAGAYKILSKPVELADLLI